MIHNPRGGAAGEERDRPSKGVVYLVGGGPGDPGLLTVAAARLLRRADVVVHDALIGPAILDLIPASTERIDVGKRCGGRRTTQERIHEILIDAARKHRTVVRLKGGDPFVFGRGGEEALALRAAGIRFRVVPGVTAGVGVSAYAGIPVTHRGVSASVTFVTGHEDVGGAQSRIDWEALARVDGTLVVYMGVGTLGGVADRLIRAGKYASTPAAVVEWGTVSRQRTVASTLGEIAALAAAEGISSPALVVIGEVVALRDSLTWFESLPLLGRRIVVARSRPQPSRISRALARLGAEVIETPRLLSVPTRLDPASGAAVRSVGEYDWVVFTSVAAVDAFWRELSDVGLDSRTVGSCRVASFGAETTTALARRGITPDVAARTFAVDRVSLLIDEVRRLAGARVLLPRDGRLTSPIADALREAGASVDEIAVYQSVEEQVPEGEIEDVDFVVIPSSSAARALVGAGAAPLGRVIAIGPSTAETARSLGISVDVVAEEHSVAGVVRAIRGAIEARRLGLDPVGSSASRTAALTLPYPG